MNVHLLYRDRDFDPKALLPRQADALVQDLELTTLFEGMARGDGFVSEVAKRLLLSGAGASPGAIRYRQGILADCLDRPAAVRELYSLAVEAAELEKKLYLSSLVRSPSWVLRRAVEHMEGFLGVIRKLKRHAERHGRFFASEGWIAFFERLRLELGDEYVSEIEEQLERLKFREGISLGAGLGEGNKGTDYVLHRPPLRRKIAWWRRLGALFRRQSPDPSFSIDPRDESGARALEELRDRGIALAAGALARSRDHVRGFFIALRTELAFYVGCMNLHEELAGIGEPVCFPVPEAAEGCRLSFRGVYDPCLALRLRRVVVGNDVEADGKELLVVTGANQGGKSTFLRSVGLARLMMQCGMFVPARTFRSSVCGALFTQYRREEDATLESGKLDEELGRMSDIVDRVHPGDTILFNEPFASTNEREGSEIAWQILSALLERRIRMVCVTHLHELARRFFEENAGNILFLRAGREEDGTRSFRLSEGEPLETSFGEDLYRDVFADGSPSRT